MGSTRAVNALAMGGSPSVQASASDESNRCAREYTVGALHANTIESFWSPIKLGVMGSYHKFSRKYLPLYVAEFQFRYNNRENADIFGEAIRGC